MASPDISLPRTQISETETLTALTLRGMQLAASAAGLAAEVLISGDSLLYDQINDCEKQLDCLDREIDERVAGAVAAAPALAIRELLACLKLMTDLERIGDHIASVASRGRAVGKRLDMRDTADLIKMASVLEQMLLKVEQAFSGRDLDAAVDVLRADAEIDRIRNLVYVRLIEDHEGVSPESVHLLFMAHALERAGDHVKNLAEEVCHVLSGHTLRHVLRSQDQPVEQMFLRWLREKHGLTSSAAH